MSASVPVSAPSNCRSPETQHPARSFSDHRLSSRSPLPNKGKNRLVRIKQSHAQTRTQKRTQARHTRFAGSRVQLRTCTHAASGGLTFPSRNHSKHVNLNKPRELFVTMLYFHCKLGPTSTSIFSNQQQISKASFCRVTVQERKSPHHYRRGEIHQVQCICSPPNVCRGSLYH